MQRVAEDRVPKTMLFGAVQENGKPLKLRSLDEVTEDIREPDVICSH